MFVDRMTVFQILRFLSQSSRQFLDILRLAVAIGGDRNRHCIMNRVKR